MRQGRSDGKRAQQKGPFSSNSGSNLASFVSGESGFLRTGIDRVPQRHAPRPSRRSACASRNCTFFAPRHPAIASPFPHPSADPPGYPRPGKHTGAHPSARGKGPSSAPVSAPTSVRPSLRASFQHPRRGVLRTAAPATSQPVAQRCVSKAAPAPCAFASHPLPSH